MSYTPPTGNAANLNFSINGGYSAPAGNAANLDFVGIDGVVGYASASTPLGAVQAIGRQAVAGSAQASTPLGSIQARAFFGWVGYAQASTPLGQIAALAQHGVAGHVAASTPLGAVQALGQIDALPVSGFVVVSTPLGSIHALGRQYPTGQGAASTPLGSMAVVAYHDFSVVPEVANASIFYTCQLVNNGEVLTTVPMSSWQATLQVDRANYVQAVFPAIGAVADVLASLPATAEFVILRGVKLSDGASVQQEMARAPCQTLQFDRGPYNHTCTVRGYTDGFTGLETAPSGRALRQIRSISSGSGGRRVRCAVDWFLRPGNTVQADGVDMVASFTNYYVTGNDEYMDVGERA